MDSFRGTGTNNCIVRAVKTVGWPFPIVSVD